MTERKTIKIASVGQWKDVGKAKVLAFSGEDRVNYETWSETLAEHIKVGATIEADVDFSENQGKDGKVYLHNKIVQIFIDGQPVKSRSRGFTPDSPEKINSIESQKRADLICQLWIAGIIREGDPLVAKVKAWLGKLEEAIEPVPAQRQAEKSSDSPATKPASHDIPTGGFANAGEFLTACSKNLGLNRSQVLIKLGIKILDNVNFTDAYQVLKESPEEYRAGRRTGDIYYLPGETER